MRFNWLSIPLAAGLLALTVPAPASTLLRFEPTNPVVTAGDTLQVDLLLDATGGDAIIGFGMDLLFDPALLGFDSFSFNPVFTGLTDATEVAPGTLSLLAFQGFPVSELSGLGILLGQVTFSALNAGSDLLDLAFPGHGLGLQGLFMSESAGEGIELPDAQNPVLVTINPAPGPATAGLLLLGLVALRRRRTCR